MTKRLADNDLTLTKALPNGAAAVTTDAFDLGHGTRGDFVANCELEVQAPALVVGDLANTETMTYDVIESANADLSSPTTIASGLIVQTGAGGAGAAAASARFKFPDGVARYVGVVATNSASGDASDKSLTARLLF